jgi:hypothetical protein
MHIDVIYATAKGSLNLPATAPSPLWMPTLPSCHQLPPSTVDLIICEALAGATIFLANDSWNRARSRSFLALVHALALVLALALFKLTWFHGSPGYQCGIPLPEFLFGTRLRALGDSAPVQNRLQAPRLSKAGADATMTSNQAGKHLAKPLRDSALTIGCGSLASSGSSIAMTVWTNYDRQASWQSHCSF